MAQLLGSYALSRFMASHSSRHYNQHIERLTETFRTLTRAYACSPSGPAPSLPTCMGSISMSLSIVFGDLRELGWARATGGDAKENMMNAKYLQTLRKDHPAFINELVIFVFSPRTVKEVLQLTFPLHHCSCDTTDIFVAEAHVAPDPGADQDHSLFDFCSSIFHILMKIMSPDLQHAKLAKHYEPGVPIKPKDKAYEALAHHFIGNPLSVLQSSFSWYTATKSLCVIEFLTADASHNSHVHQLMQGVYYSSPTLLLELLHALVGRLDQLLRCVIFSKDYNASSPGFTGIDATCLSPIINIGRLLSFSFPETVEVPSSASSNQLKLLYTSLCRLISKYGRSDSVAVFNGSDEMAQDLAWSIAKPALILHGHLQKRGAQDLGPLDYTVRKLCASRTVITEQNVAAALVNSIHILGYNRMCKNERCKRLPPDAKKSNQSCGGCHIFCYCSKTCQKEAWSSGLVPHRSICKDIAKLVEVWGKTTAETKRIVDVRSPEWDRDFSQISANFNLHLCILAAEQGIDKEGLARVLVQLQRFNADMGMGDSK
ncbi:hypothetical protein BDV98DRAFT_657736 [Pterulicium gracile]|uniref:MYND-type domain-containing protein n=1 Tax=Pterulicium gracile TaxID=1884261 RepID=A0A5C3QAH6_9AGAR|nr:hypothetical protein BDV98DRAFT_657736 [Pterula gracilis]